MNLLINIPVNLGDIVYSVQKFGEMAKLDTDDINEVKINSFSLNVDGIYIVDKNLDWWGFADKMDMPISEPPNSMYAMYSTLKNSEEAIREWNRRIDEERNG